VVRKSGKQRRERKQQKGEGNITFEVVREGSEDIERGK
jgi:hypothetical protein